MSADPYAHYKYTNHLGRSGYSVGTHPKCFLVTPTKNGTWEVWKSDSLSSSFRSPSLGQCIARAEALAGVKSADRIEASFSAKKIVRPAPGTVWKENKGWRQLFITRVSDGFVFAHTVDLKDTQGNGTRVVGMDRRGTRIRLDRFVDGFTPLSTQPDISVVRGFIRP